MGQNIEIYGGRLTTNGPNIEMPEDLKSEVE